VLIVLYAFNRRTSRAGRSRLLGALVQRSLARPPGTQRVPAVGTGRLIATALALLLGSAVAYALHKFKFFGREAISFLLVLPLGAARHHHRDRAELLLLLHRGSSSAR
jgi:hypothetical protein